jgi:hypothetical protein
LLFPAKVLSIVPRLEAHERRGIPHDFRYCLKADIGPLHGLTGSIDLTGDAAWQVAA